MTHQAALDKARAMLIGLTVEARERHVQAHGVFPAWAYVSTLYMEVLTGHADCNVAAAVVAGMVVYENPKLPGVSVCTVAGRGEQP